MRGLSRTVWNWSSAATFSTSALTVRSSGRSSVVQFICYRLLSPRSMRQTSGSLGARIGSDKSGYRRLSTTKDILNLSGHSGHRGQLARDESGNSMDEDLKAE